jgi:hypothetical protein
MADSDMPTAADYLIQESLTPPQQSAFANGSRPGAKSNHCLAEATCGTGNKVSAAIEKCPDAVDDLGDGPIQRFGGDCAN